MKILTLFATGVALLVLTPPLSFLVCGALEGMAPGALFDALRVQAGAGARPSLWASTILGLLPLLGLCGVLALWRRWRGDAGLVRRQGFAALGALLLVQIWANAEFWSLFLPAAKSPGWPHGLELVIAPLFFAPPAMLVALVLATLLKRR